MTIRITLIILQIAGLLATLIWLLTSPGWEPLAATIILISTLIGTIFLSKAGGKTKLIQKGGKGSTNYQSKRDINIKIRK